MIDNPWSVTVIGDFVFFVPQKFHQELNPSESLC